MKKYLLGVVIAGCMTGVNFSYAAEEHSETADKAVEASDTTETSSSASSMDAYAGWYLGAGLSYQHTTGEALLSDNMGEFSRGRYANAHGLSLIKTNVGRLGGGIVGGYGTFLDNTIYVGGEFTVDITGSKKNENTDSMYKLSFLKTKGFIPTLAVRFGTYISNIDLFFYVKGGVTFLNSKFENNDTYRESISSQRVTPIVGIGIERKLCDVYSVRVEGDYRFLSEKTKDGILGYRNTGAIMNNYSASVKNKTHGYAIRILCIYHF